MLDIGWSELLLIGVVALIVVGPKDLPHMFHSLGRMTAKARAMGREFSRAMEEAARDSGLDAAAQNVKDLKGLTSKKSLGLDALDRVTEKFENWDPKLPGAIKAPGAAAFPADPQDAAPTAFEAHPDELDDEPDLAPEPAPAPAPEAKPKPAEAAGAADKPAPKPGKKPAAKKGEA